MRRFYKHAAATPDHGVALDGRPVRTPGRVPLVAPGAALAEAIAAEWAAQGDQIDPRAMVLTGLANAAIDRVAPDPAGFARGLSVYGESDLLCYRAEGPEPLVRRQAAAWDPLLAWAASRYDIAFTVTAGIVHRSQPAETLDRLAAATAARHPFILSGLSPLVTISGSLVAALAVTEGALTADAVWDAVTIDERWQAEQWGEDGLATQALEARRVDFMTAVRFVSLAQSDLQ
jgi:chaperone required for assembly of F1-ATPase